MSGQGGFEFTIREALRQLLLDLRLAGITHLPRRCFQQETGQASGDLPQATSSFTPRVRSGIPPVSGVIAESVGEASSVTTALGSSAEPARGVSAGGPKEADRIPRETFQKASTPSASPRYSEVPQGDVKAPEVIPQTPAGFMPPPRSSVSDFGFSALTLPVWAQELTEPILSAEEKKRRLAALEAKVAKCTRCPELVANRSRTVFSDGNPESRLVFIGEAPGAEEDRQGIPFVGRAGQLLTDIITKGMGLRREDVYICNVIKCRPPENRTPTPTEVANCRDFLDEQLAIIRPEFICCLGSVAAQRILGTKQSMTRLRGQVIPLGRVKVVCTYHPAYLLRNPEAKRETWEDIKLLMREMGLPLPPARRGPR